MLPSNPICPVCNYATSAVYCDLPSPEQLANGVKPLDSLPAAWWNNMWSMVNCSVNQARGAVGSFITEINNVLAGAGICPNCVCTDQLYQAIEKIRQTIGSATVAGAVKSSSTPGMVSIDENGFMTANCVGNAAQLATTAHTLVGAVNELKTTYDACTSGLTTAVNSKAPTYHAISEATYGVGTATAYGHLRISNTYTSDLGDAGMAASQSALYSVYNYATQISAAAIGLGNVAGCALGTASAGSATTAARSDHVHPMPSCVMDKYNGAQCIGIGYSGPGLSAAQLTQFAAYSTNYENGCVVIKDVSADTVKQVLGLGNKLGAVYTNDYWGIADPNGDQTAWIRTTSSGIIPYQQGNYDNGHNYLGTDSWYFAHSFIQQMDIGGFNHGCISHLNAAFMHIYTDAPQIAFNKQTYHIGGICTDSAGSVFNGPIYYNNINCFGGNAYFCCGIFINNGVSACNEPGLQYVLGMEAYACGGRVYYSQAESQAVGKLWLGAYPGEANQTLKYNAARFWWSAQCGQPEWVWGGNGDGSNMYVYSPSNFNVNYATSAGSAGSATTAGTASNANALGGLGWTGHLTDLVEHTNYWAYIEKSKFTFDGGYIVFSNGLCIQWGVKQSNVEAIASGGEHTFHVTMYLQYASTQTYRAIYSIASDASSAGDEYHENNSVRTTISFEVYLYNRNNSAWIMHPQLEWITIGFIN